LSFARFSATADLTLPRANLSRTAGLPVSSFHWSLIRVVSPSSYRVNLLSNRGDDEVSVPLTEEEVVVVEKRPVVKKEVRIRKEVVEDTEVVEEDVRREDVEVDDETTGRSS
jgi:hypothetical protein